MFDDCNTDLHILTDEEFKDNIADIEKQVEKHRKSGYFYSKDSKKLYYEYFLQDDAKASVVIVHGLSEFTKKYYELTYYFLECGYNVFVYDQRCHGLSVRLTKVNDLIHVGSFKHYVTDLECFMDEIVCKVCGDLPVNICSHSMGGAVTLMYLVKNPGKIHKAVLSAPMLQPNTGNVSHTVSRWGAFAKSMVCGKKSKFFKNREFDPDKAKNKAKDKSYNRFLYNLNLRINEPMYRSTPLTSWWVYNSLSVRPIVLKEKFIQSIKTPLLMFCASNDVTVDTDVQLDFSKRCQVCDTVILQDSTHSILTDSYENICTYITKMLEFYKN